jgi:hypothetical protein
MIIRGTYINQSFQPGADIERLYAQVSGLVLNEAGHIPNNTAVNFVVEGVSHACFWNGWGSIKGPEYPNEWFQTLGLGHRITCAVDPAGTAVVVEAAY